MISQEALDRIRAETDIVQLVGGYVQLKKAGRNFRGLCPFHTERSPSFYVSPERSTYHCFGCGAGGNAVSFVMAMEKLDFPEAVRLLAGRLGIRIPEERTAGSRTTYEACETAASFFERQLSRSEPARGYVERRRLSPEAVKRFRLGYVPAGNLLRGEALRRSWSETGLVQAGLLVERGGGLGDYFQERLMFPIFSMSGKVIGFSGRVLDDREPKYLNSPDTAIFKKGDCLYGSFQAKGYIREERPVLVEGNFDVLSLVDRGINTAVAPLGTAVTRSQAGLLKRYNDQVLVCLDGDEAGRKATARALGVLLECGMNPQVLIMPDGFDPDAYVREFGKQGLLKLAAEAVDAVGFMLLGRGLRSVPERREAIREVVGLLRVVSDDTMRELYVRELADRFEIDPSVVGRALAVPAPEDPVSKHALSIEEKLLAAATQDASLARIARDCRLSDVLVDDRLKAIASLVEKQCDEPDFGPARLMDSIESEELRRSVARWTLSESALPRPSEFKSRMHRLRADWLQRRIVAAHEAGSEGDAEVLTKERCELLREVSHERS